MAIEGEYRFGVSGAIKGLLIVEYHVTSHLDEVIVC